jgi:hypothetical protein
MAANPLQKLGQWRAAEGALEVGLPMSLMGFAWYAVYSYAGTPATGRGLTIVELTALLGAAVAVTAWAFSRQLYMLRRRKPWTAVATGWMVTGVVLAVLPPMSRSSFSGKCEKLGGEVVNAAILDQESRFSAGCEGIGGKVVYDVDQEAKQGKYRYRCSVVGGEVVEALAPLEREQFRKECELRGGGARVEQILDPETNEEVMGYRCPTTGALALDADRAASFVSSCQLLGGTVLEGVDPTSRARVPYGCASFESARYLDGERVCRIGGVEGNAYLPGVVLRPNWNGRIHPFAIAFLGLVSMASSLGLRDRRLRKSRMGESLFNLLRYAASVGNKSGMGKPPPKGDKIVACTNPTFWGEICGQVYSADKAWLPGQWCSRCRQTFTPCDRYVTLKVVSLFTADVDVLNGLERLDTVSWPRGEPMVPDARISGEERWVQLGMVRVPDVISVAQLLSIVHDEVPGWGAAGGPRVQEAAKLAKKRASRVAAWFWFGTLAHRLTYARPNNRSVLGLGATRLRDLLGEGGEELWLQLDVGVFPLEVRTGFRKTFVEDDKKARAENSKVDLWIPTSSPNDQQGLWVPRIEGEALRAWLATDRLRDASERGVSSPLAYWRFTGDAVAEEELHRAPKAGTLDYLRTPLDASGMEPTLERGVGSSMAEWDWLEWEQIELLRQQALVLVENRG